MKKHFALIFTMISLASCSQYHSKETNNNDKSITTVPWTGKLAASYGSLISPGRSWESDVFLIGWKASPNLGYDVTTLSQEEIGKFIDDGIRILTEDADKEEHAKVNRTILTHYYYGKQDFKKTIYWAYKGSESGSAPCMRILSIAYLKGELGVVQNFEEGLKWAYLGAACGDEPCKAVINTSYAEYMKSDNLRSLILDSQRQATDWMKTHKNLFASEEKMDEKNYLKWAQLSRQSF